MKNFKVELEVSLQTIEDTLISAVEGGSGYWARNMEPLKRTENDFYKDCIKNGFKLQDIEADKEVRVTRSSIQLALDIMITEYPKHFTDMMNENGDATTGDVLLQCMTFGEVIYG